MRENEWHTGLKVFLGGLRQRDFWYQARKELPAEPAQLIRQVKKLGDRFGSLASSCPREEVLARVRAELLIAWRQRVPLNSLSPVTLRLGTWVIWSADFEPANEREFVENFPAAGVRRGRGRFVRNLVHTFLLYYPQYLSTFEEWRQVVRSLVMQYAERQGKLLEYWNKWRRFNILSKGGSQQLASNLLRSSEPLELVRQAGLDVSLARSKFLEVTLRGILALLRTELQSERFSADRLSVLQVFLYEGNHRFPQLAGEIGDSLLLPFQENNPPETTRIILIEFFRDLFGDPRLQPQRWYGVSNQAQAVMRRWLARVTLEDFFRVIDATADPNHWRQRRAFWMRYWEGGLMVDAWVALGPSARARLSEEAKGGYGRLYGSLRNHAALLLRIGTAIVVEWSHSGACRIYPADAAQKPTLFAQFYLASDLRAETEYKIIHNYNWQQKLATVLHEVAGVPRLVEADLKYRPSARWS